MKLRLAYYGDPVLRKKALPVEEINDEIKKLIADMIDTMQAHDGLGLAAPQVHISLAIFVTGVPQQLPDGKWVPGKIRVFINPRIISVSEKNVIFSEGCLSMPKIYGDVERPASVIIEAVDLEGNSFQEEFVGLDARAILHEKDHLNGVLFVDRIYGKARKDLEPKLRLIKKTLSSKE
jgi:peptide deformylase